MQKIIDGLMQRIAMRRRDMGAHEQAMIESSQYINEYKAEIEDCLQAISLLQKELDRGQADSEG